MRSIILSTLAIMVPAQPALAQTDMSVPVPLPDTNGADPDLTCFVVLGSAAQDAKGTKDGEMFASATGYYVGRLMARLPDRQALDDQTAKLFTTLPATDLRTFKLPCLQRYGVTLGIVQDALKSVRRGAK